MTRPRVIVRMMALFLGGWLVCAWGDVSLDAAQKARYQQLCQSLVAPCCWRESLAMHRSPESLQARDEVAALIAAGKSDAEILADFESRHGARVLMEPRGERSTWLYVLPVLALAAGLLFAARFLQKRLRHGAPEGGPSPEAEDSDWGW